MYIYFKILHSIRVSWLGFITRHKLASYTVLSKKRFEFGNNFMAGHGLHIQTDLSGTTISIGGNFFARKYFNVVMGHNGKLNIGDNNFFNNNCSINCLGEVTIGNDCQFGENVLMYDHNHHYKEAGKLIRDQGYKTGKIVIGNNCWIGSNAVVLKDVTIGDNVVIGAGCIIHSSIADGTIVYNKQDLQMISRRK